MLRGDFGIESFWEGLQGDVVGGGKVGEVGGGERVVVIEDGEGGWEVVMVDCICESSEIYKCGNPEAAVRSEEAQQLWQEPLSDLSLQGQFYEVAK